MRFVKLTLTTHRLPGFTAIGATFLALSACSSLSLPTLSGSDAVRDQVACTEVAASRRATQLAEVATECVSCSAALRSIASAPHEWLEVLGGLWDPRGGVTPEGESAPATASEAPTDVSAFALWLARTATRDLEIIANPNRTTSERARTLSVTSLGRYANAVTIAHAYGVEVNTGLDWTLLVNDRVNAASRQGVRTWSIDLFDSPILSSSFAPLGKKLPDSEELSIAVATWDCTASTLSKAQVSAGSLSDAYAVSGKLLVRIDIALRAGATGTHSPRRNLGFLDASSLATNLLAADAAMLASDSADMRAMGASAALMDIEQWTPCATLPALIGAH